MNRLSIILVGIFLAFAFSSCEEDRHLDWRFINMQWLEQQKARLCDETGEKFWTETESGLLFRVINEGIGNNDFTGRPSNRSWVVIKYEGKFLNNFSFDDRFRPNNEDNLEYGNSLTGFVPGFQEALRMMRQNAIIDVIIPYELGYGSDGMGAAIPPYSVIQFRIEMVRFFSE